VNVTRRTLRHAGLAVLVLAAGLRAAEAAPFTFSFGTIPPTGSLTAGPGELVGWGYTVTNEDPDHWLELIALDADPFAFAAPGLPASVFDFPILAPAASRATPWVPGMAGLYEFAFVPDVPAGFTNSGLFHVSVLWWDGDPLQGGAPLGEGVGSAAFAVTAVPGTVVPEPTTLLLLGSGVAGVLVRRRRPRG
jgi:hypothetical protein